MPRSPSREDQSLVLWSTAQNSEVCSMFQNITKTELNYTLSEHMHSSKATRVARFSLAMLKHIEIKACNMFHLLCIHIIYDHIYLTGFFFPRKSDRMI